MTGLTGLTGATAIEGPDPRHAVLLEPVPIGPVVARNRFFQVPHCNGMGFRAPSAHAGMRRVKAEGGWAVVCTEEVEIHPSSDLTPYVEGRLWSDDDIPALALLADAVHDGGALAGIELVHNGMSASNLTTREVPLGPSHLPVLSTHPVQARAMTLDDLADLRRWHRAAVRRSLQAGFDLVYVYAGHGLSGLQQFLSPATTCGTTRTAARSPTGCACCARCSRTPSTRPPAARLSPSGSASTSSWGRAASPATR